MTTDKTTLADVQPGGRVRLGEHRGELDPTRIAETVGAREYGVPPYRYFAFTTDQLAAFAAALSAQPSPATCKEGLQVQPSPGGQGGLNYERMFVDACAALAEVSRELGCDPEQGGAEPILAAIAELREALAARQPVGVPDFFMVRDEDESRWRESDEATFDSVKRQRPDDAIALYTAPPAQAVDLGQFRDLAEFALRNAKLHNCWEKREALARELLALIDSQGAR